MSDLSLEKHKKCLITFLVSNCIFSSATVAPDPTPKSDAFIISCCKTEMDNFRAVCDSNNKRSIMNIPSITNDCPEMLQSETSFENLQQVSNLHLGSKQTA